MILRRAGLWPCSYNSNDTYTNYTFSRYNSLLPLPPSPISTSLPHSPIFIYLTSFEVTLSPSYPLYLSPSHPLSICHSGLPLDAKQQLHLFLDSGTLFLCTSGNLRHQVNSCCSRSSSSSSNNSRSSDSSSNGGRVDKA